ncbi:MAG: DUF2066 domain-containing protein [Gammaproteobacteria bacterium]|nr:DUF2066 domain-containing protein [Gammaproteobacteria bacterium]
MLIVLSGVLVLMPVSVFAVEVKGLHDIKVPVQNRKNDQLILAFKEALSVILVRITGKSRVTEQREVRDILTKSSRYVQQYQYLETDDEPAQLNLWVRFDGKALERDLVKAALPIWGKERPAVLMWLAVEAEGGRYLVGEGGDFEIYEQINTVAEKLAIPVIFPLLDLEDRNLVSAADVIGGFDQRLRQASDRYRPDVVLMARARGMPNDFWNINWRFYAEDETTDWSSKGKDINAVVTEGIKQLAEVLSSRLAVNYQAQQGLTAVLLVDGVEDLEDYARLLGYINGLAHVSRYRLFRVEPGRVGYWLYLRGASQDLERLIDLGGVLDKVAMPASIPPPLATDASIENRASLSLHYQLIPGE